jgi:hypothetical protein
MNTKTIAAAIATALLAACATTPDTRVATAAPRPEPVNPTRVFFYPQQGQAEDRQDRDRYECYNWSVRQTGFDPARRLAPRDARAAVVPARSPLQTVGAAAAIGAMAGAIIAKPGDALEGAAVGAMAGTVLGSVAANNETQHAQPVRYTRRSVGANRYEHEAAEYRRAMSACLEGRGYSVK